MGVPGGPLSILRMGEGSKDPYARTGTRLDGHWCNQGVPGRTWGQGGPLPVHRSGGARVYRPEGGILRSGTRIFRPPHTPRTLKIFVKILSCFE